MDSSKHSNNVVQQKPNQPRRLHKVSSLKFPRNSDTASSSSSSSSSSSGKDIPRYTSLRDLKDANGNGYFDRNNGSEISIKNRLVKHAASAYLQSSAILIGADRNGRDYFASFRDTINRNKAALCSCWRAYVRDPIMACLRPILRFFSLVAW